MADIRTSPTEQNKASCRPEAKSLTKQRVARLIANNRRAGLSEDQLKELCCTLIGHSNIVEGCFGYVHCGRCEAQIGDTLAGSYRNDDAVIVGHDCEVCRENAKRLTWRDTFMAKDPQVGTSAQLGTQAEAQTNTAEA